MSRTYRRDRKSPTRERKPEGRFVPYFDTSCRHHGGCPWCERGRTHASRRREPVAAFFDLTVEG